MIKKSSEIGKSNDGSSYCLDIGFIFGMLKANILNDHIL